MSNFRDEQLRVVPGAWAMLLPGFVLSQDVRNERRLLIRVRAATVGLIFSVELGIPVSTVLWYTMPIIGSIAFL